MPMAKLVLNVWFIVCAVEETQRTYWLGKVQRNNIGINNVIDLSSTNKRNVIFGPTKGGIITIKDGYCHTSTLDLGLVKRVTTLLFLALWRHLGFFVCDSTKRNYMQHCLFSFK